MRQEQGRKANTQGYRTETATVCDFLGRRMVREGNEGSDLKRQPGCGVAQSGDLLPPIQCPHPFPAFPRYSHLVNPQPIHVFPLFSPLGNLPAGPTQTRGPTRIYCLATVIPIPTLLSVRHSSLNASRHHLLFIFHVVATFTHYQLHIEQQLPHLLSTRAFSSWLHQRRLPSPSSVWSTPVSRTDANSRQTMPPENF